MIFHWWWYGKLGCIAGQDKTEPEHFASNILPSVQAAKQPASLSRAQLVSAGMWLQCVWVQNAPAGLQLLWSWALGMLFRTACKPVTKGGRKGPCQDHIILFSVTPIYRQRDNILFFPHSVRKAYLLSTEILHLSCILMGYPLQCSLVTELLLAAEPTLYETLLKTKKRLHVSILTCICYSVLAMDLQGGIWVGNICCYSRACLLVTQTLNVGVLPVESKPGDLLLGAVLQGRGESAWK